MPGAESTRILCSFDNASKLVRKLTIQDDDRSLFSAHGVRSSTQTYMMFILESKRMAPLKFLMIISEATLSDICTMAAPSLFVRNFTWDNNNSGLATIKSEIGHILLGKWQNIFSQEKCFYPFTFKQWQSPKETNFQNHQLSKIENLNRIMKMLLQKFSFELSHTKVSSTYWKFRTTLYSIISK